MNLSKERKKERRMKKKIILSSFLTIALCFSLLAGATFALFTSEDKVDIAITSGKVEMQASVENLETWSLEDDKTLSGRTDGTFSQGGTATFVEGVLTLANVIPGDKVSFNVTGINNSTVNVQYRVKVKCVDGEKLMSELVLGINGKEYTTLLSYTSAWATLEKGQKMDDLAVTVELPANVGDEYQNLTTSLIVIIEAVQGNAGYTDAEEVVRIVKNEDALLTAISEGESSIYLTASEYEITEPLSLENIEITGTDGVSFVTPYGETGLNIGDNVSITGVDFKLSNTGNNGNKVINVTGDNVLITNSTFDTSRTNYNAIYVSADAGDVTIDGCEFIGGYRQIGDGIGSVDSKVVIKNCKFYGSKSTYAIHFDQLHCNLVVENCYIQGITAIGRNGNGTLQFTNCEFANGGNYNRINIYRDATYKECTFGSQFAFAVGKEGTTQTFVDCISNGWMNQSTVKDAILSDSFGYEVTFVVDGTTYVYDSGWK